MKIAAYFVPVYVVLAAGLAVKADELSAPAAPAAPNTLWHFLGIPQGYQKIRDAKVNKNGNRPQRERKPPLKRIADPENLESQNPAIKEAAKIKTEEDLAQQKIKAIKYLATIGCGCYPGVREALLAALDDCTEAVRYEAAIAFCQAAGNPCTHCNRSGCCNAAVMTKLNEMAHGQDEQGCWKESSPRVRAAAENALNACRQVIPPAQGPTPAKPEQPPKEVPIQPIPAAPVSLPSFPERPSPSDSSEAASMSSPEGMTLRFPGSEEKPSAVFRMVGAVSSTEAGNAEIWAKDDLKGAETVAVAGLIRPFRRCPPGYEPIICPCPAEERKAAPEKPAPEGAAEPAAAPPSALAGTYGAARGPMSSAPNMIGDLFGSPGGSASIVRTFTFNGLFMQQVPPNEFYTVLQNGTRVALNDSEWHVLDYNDATAKLGGLPLTSVAADGTLVDGYTGYYGETGLYTTEFRVLYDVDLPSPGNGGVVGRTKIAENTSPIPRDRLLLNYSYFNGVPLFPGGVDVNRLTPGFEKTFFNNWMSLEMKIPMATTLDSTIVQGGTTSTSQYEFGNMAVTFKSLVLRRETFLFSGGLMVTVPTADDTLLVLPDGTPLIAVRNRSTHLGPFLGFLWAPNDRFFAQGFLQWDVAANGNPVLIDQQQQRGLEYVGDLHDAAFQYLDLGIGSWLYRSDGAPRRVTGLAWTAEVHWNKSLEPTDVITAGDFRVGDYCDNVESINLTLGAHLELCDRTTITAGYTCPLGGGRDREFNGEFRLMLNRFFGSSYRTLPAPSL